MLRGIYGDPERYKATYWSRFPGVYFAGDGARRDEDGDYWLMGRVDDVMNVSGHRLSTIEIESALVDDKRVAEAAVVGRPDDVTGEAIFCFVILKSDVEPTPGLGEDLRQHVATKIGAIARPRQVMFTPDLPKTRSGRSCAACCETSHQGGNLVTRRPWRMPRLSNPSGTQPCRHPPTTSSR